ncbi:MAG: SbcC/MukB-like Walker B domain-containing protein [Evtepia sp.]
MLDHYNGTERSADTLSGGEAFLASLSLALGLSDEVQASAGGIQMDTLFVDEGFGSLSEQALDLALQALAGLSDGNRLVGVISHVAELKERIDRQIVVCKERSGGSFASIRERDDARNSRYSSEAITGTASSPSPAFRILQASQQKGNREKFL